MITMELLLRVPLFASLRRDELEELARVAADVQLDAGEWLAREGDSLKFFVVIEGQMVLIKDVLGLAVSKMDLAVGEWFGEVSALFGLPTQSALRAVTACRVVQFDRQTVQKLVQGASDCGATILRVMNERLAESEKHVLAMPSSRVRLVGNVERNDLLEIRTFLRLNRIPYEWDDKTFVHDEGLGEFGVPKVYVDGSCCSDLIPTVRDVANALGLGTLQRKDTYDLAVVGGGPAGLAAAVYGASEGLSVLLIERSAVGGQAGTSSRIENYLGFFNGISGDDLSERASKQAQRFGAEMIVTREVMALSRGAQCYRIALDGGQEVSCKSVILATGVEWRRLRAEGLERLLGRGVSYGAAPIEPGNLVGKEVFIVGGGNSAGQAAVFFAKYAKHVTVLVRGADVASSMSHYLIDQMGCRGNISVETGTEIIAVKGKSHLEGIVTRSVIGDTHREAGVLCVMIGANASTAWLPGNLERDERGYIKTGRDLSVPLEVLGDRSPFHLETNLPGLFCAGDVRSGSIKRVASAVGEGSMAVAFVHQFLALELH